MLSAESGKFSVKHEDIGRPLYFDAQATTPMVRMSISFVYLVDKAKVIAVYKYIYITGPPST